MSLIDIITGRKTETRLTPNTDPNDPNVQAILVNGDLDSGDMRDWQESSHLDPELYNTLRDLIADDSPAQTAENIQNTIDIKLKSPGIPKSNKKRLKEWALENGYRS